MTTSWSYDPNDWDGPYGHEKANKLIRYYIEKALRERLKREHPGYGIEITEAAVASSMRRLDVSTDVLYRAIELAAEDE